VIKGPTRRVYERLDGLHGLKYEILLPGKSEKIKAIKILELTDTGEGIEGS